MRKHQHLRPLLAPFAIIATIAVAAGAVAATGVTSVVQKNRAFSVASMQIGSGDLVRFNNEDKFFHQIYVEAPTFNFESEEQQVGTSVDLRFPKAGTFEVRCHIHPKMLLKVDVR